MNVFTPYPRLTRKTKQTTGFTIVELLIVIVVIAILAAISIVAYNGIQERARYSVMQQDIASVNKAILMYYADNGHYPCNMTSTDTISYYTGTAGGEMKVPNVVPEYISKFPTIPTNSNGDFYGYMCSAGGVEYKLVRLVAQGKTVPSVELSNPGIDPHRGKRGWGVWSSGGSSL